MRWRHEGYKNPLPEAWYPGEEGAPDDIWDHIFTQNTLNGVAHDLYEAGYADAIEAVVAWGDELCPDKAHVNASYGKRRKECPDCWRKLREGK